MSAIKLSPQHALILKLLLKDPTEGKYGLQLVREAAGGLSSGGIYVQLQRLKKKGLVNSTRVPQASGPPRHLFRVTGLGYKAYRVHDAAEQARAEAERRLETGGILVPS